MIFRSKRKNKVKPESDLDIKELDAFIDVEVKKEETKESSSSEEDVDDRLSAGEPRHQYLYSTEYERVAGLFPDEPPNSTPIWILLFFMWAVVILALNLVLAKNELNFAQFIWKMMAH